MGRSHRLAPAPQRDEVAPVPPSDEVAAVPPSDEVVAVPPSDETAASRQREPQGVGPSKPAVPEVGGPKGPEPTRYGDWEKGGRCIDF